MRSILLERVSGMLSILILVVINFFLPCIGHSGQVALTWEKPYDNRVAGYNIYYGISGTNFKSSSSQTIYSADQTSCLIFDLKEDRVYGFAATSFDLDGNESDFSETIKYFVGSSNEAQTLVFGDTLNADYPGTVEDSFIDLNEEVHDTSKQLNTYTWPENMPANAILLKFDLSQLPAGTQIRSATLWLYQTAAGGDATYDVSVNKIINHHPALNQANGNTCDGITNWTANNVCYNSIPLAQADIGPAEDVNSLDQSLGYKNWNVTGMVQKWAAKANTNYGLMLNSDTVAGADSYRFFASSESIDAAQRPRLEIVYTANEFTDVDMDGDGYAINAGDCNDSDALIYPGALEICGDGIDQDCNGVDLTCLEDIDNDGDGYTANDSDCNDNDATIFPGAIEICGDGIDQDCNGVDLTCLEDINDDGDGDGYTENEGDCSDNDATALPGAIEIFGDRIDQDCSGIRDSEENINKNVRVDRNETSPNFADFDNDDYANKQEDQSSTDVQDAEPIPQAPVANAGPDQTINEGETVTLNGSNSNDSDDGIVNYKWEQISGTRINLFDFSAVQTTFKSPDVDTDGESLSFKLIVTDTLGQTSADTCIINITWNNESPVADAGMDKIVDQGGHVILDGSGSYDTDDGISAYLWDQKSGPPVVLSDPSSAITSFTAPLVENSSAKLSFRLIVRDSQGLQGSDEVDIIINDIITSGSSKKDGGSDSGCFINTLSE